MVAETEKKTNAGKPLRKVKQRPSYRLRLAAKKAAEDPKKSRKQAMVEAGFSEGYANQGPKDREAWNMLLGQYLDDELLLAEHQRELTTTTLETMMFPLDVSDDELRVVLQGNGYEAVSIVRNEKHGQVWFTRPDNQTRHDALETAYKIKGKMMNDKSPVVIMPVPILGGITKKDVIYGNDGDEEARQATPSD